MTNVRRTFFITKEEAAGLNNGIDWTVPQFELEDGRIFYAYISGADIMTYHSWATLDDIRAYRKKIDDAWKNRK